MRRLLLVFALAIALSLAGCIDDPTGDEEIETADDGIETTDGEAGNADGEEDSHEDDTGESTDADSGIGTPPDGELAIHHFDVGQADSTLLVAPNGETMLIDTGDWRQDGSEVLAALDERGIDRIDHLVATHGHADHIGGHAAVIESYETERGGIGAAYDSGVAHTSQTYGRYLDAIENHDVELFEVQEGDSLPFGDNVSVTVLNPPADAGSDLHRNSVVLAIEFGEFRYLTTGDAERDAERRLLDEWADELDADLYHAGHHGSSTSSTEAFLEEVAPEVAIISSALDSQYGHPHDEVLERFGEHGIETYWTGVHGDITVRTDGDGLTAEPATDETTDPPGLLELKREAVESLAFPGVSVVP